jgi:hypothetical protein
MSKSNKTIVRFTERRENLNPYGLIRLDEGRVRRFGPYITLAREDCPIVTLPSNFGRSENYMVMTILIQVLI